MAVGSVTRKSLRMSFLNALGATVTQTVPNPAPGLLVATIKAYMDLVILKNLFNSTGGDLVAVSNIVIVDTTTADMYDAPIA